MKRGGLVYGMFSLPRSQKTSNQSAVLVLDTFLSFVYRCFVENEQAVLVLQSRGSAAQLLHVCWLQSHLKALISTAYGRC